MALVLEIRTTSKKAANEIKKLAKTAGADVKTLEQKSVSASKRMATSFRKFNTLLGPLGLGAGIGGLVIGFSKLAKSVAGFDTAMREVSTLVDTTQVDMGKLNDRILDLTTRVPQTAVELSKGLYQTISAGVTDVSDALFVLENAANAAVAGLTDTFTAVDVGTTVLNAYGLEVKDIIRVNDVLFNTVKEGKTKFDLLANSIGRVAPIAAQIGLEFEELTAAAATLTKGGISTDEAMTAIRATLVQILKPAGDAQLLAKKLGIEFNATALKTKGLSGFLQDVIEKTGGNIESITTLFSNVRALAGVLALAGEQAGEFARIIDTNKNSAGAAAEATDKMAESAENVWQLFKNQLNVTLLKTGETVLPVFTGAIKEANRHLGARGFFGIISRINDPIKAYTDLISAETDATIKAWEAQKKLNEETEKGLSKFVTPLGEGEAEAHQKALRAQQILEAAEKKAKDLEILKKRGELMGLRIEMAKNLAAQNLAIANSLQEQTEAEKLLAINKKDAILVEKEVIKLKKLGVGETRKALQAQQILTNVGDQFALGLGRAVANAEDLRDVLSQITKQLANRALAGLIGGGVAALIPGGLGFLGAFRAITGFHSGGRPEVGRPSIVGERGPELFVPDRPGTIVPNQEINNNQKVNIHITAQTLDESFVRNKFVPMLKRLDLTDNLGLGLA